MRVHEFHKSRWTAQCGKNERKAKWYVRAMKYLSRRLMSTCSRLSGGAGWREGSIGQRFIDETHRFIFVFFFLRSWLIVALAHSGNPFFVLFLISFRAERHELCRSRVGHLKWSDREKDRGTGSRNCARGRGGKKYFLRWKCISSFHLRFLFPRIRRNTKTTIKCFIQNIFGYVRSSPRTAKRGGSATTDVFFVETEKSKMWKESKSFPTAEQTECRVKCTSIHLICECADDGFCVLDWSGRGGETVRYQWSAARTFSYRTQSIDASSKFVIWFISAANEKLCTARTAMKMATSTTTKPRREYVEKESRTRFGEKDQGRAHTCGIRNWNASEWLSATESRKKN